MTGSILAVLDACAAATGATFKRPRAGTTTRCPLPHHRDTSASFSVKEDWGSFKCFGCGAKGGVVDAPIAFGLATNRTESARWLAARNLIPPSDPSRATQGYVPAPNPTHYTMRDALPYPLRTLRDEALATLDAEIGPIRLRALRDFIAEWRANRDHDRWFEMMYAAIGASAQPGRTPEQAVRLARRRAALAFDNCERILNGEKIGRGWIA